MFFNGMVEKMCETGQNFNAKAHYHKDYQPTSFFLK